MSLSSMAGARGPGPGPPESGLVPIMIVLHSILHSILHFLHFLHYFYIIFRCLDYLGVIRGSSGVTRGSSGHPQGRVIIRAFLGGEKQ